MQTLKNSKNIPVYLSDLQLVRECYVGVDQGSLRGGGGSMGGGGGMGGVGVWEVVAVWEGVAVWEVVCSCYRVTAYLVWNLKQNVIVHPQKLRVTLPL